MFIYENILVTDMYLFICLSCWQDYVDVQSPQLLLQEEAEYTETKCLRAASMVLEDTHSQM